MNTEEQLPEYPEGYYSTGDPDDELENGKKRNSKIEPIKAEVSLRERIEFLFSAILFNLQEGSELDKQSELLRKELQDLRNRMLKGIKVNGEMLDALKNLLKTTNKIGYNNIDLKLLVDRLNEAIDKVDKKINQS